MENSIIIILLFSHFISVDILHLVLFIIFNQFLYQKPKFYNETLGQQFDMSP